MRYTQAEVTRFVAGSEENDKQAMENRFLIKIAVPIFVLALLLSLGGCGGSSSTANTTPPPGCTTDCGTPAALGTVSSVSLLSSCPSNYATGMSCSQATVSCPNTADIGVTYGYLAPASIKGTVFFHGGGDGMVPQDISDFSAAYLGAGYALVQMAWVSTWEDTGLTTKNIGAAACRPATLMNYIFQNVATPSGAAKCAQGFSAGSAAVGYALAWYGAGSYLDNAELVSGPVFSDIQQGCEFPQPPLLTICGPGQFGCPSGGQFQDSPSYTPGTALGVGGITGDATCGGSGGTTPTSSQSNANWKAMSIVNGTAMPSFSYPKTSLAGWVCNNGTTSVGNNSAAQGDIFYQQFTSISQTAGSFSLNPVSNCNGDEGVDQGTIGTGPGAPLGSTAITADTVAHCTVKH